MDSATPKGEAVEDQVRLMMDRFHERMPNVRLHPMPTPGDSHFDGFGTIDGEIDFIYEVKTRTDKYEDFKKWGTIFVSLHKVINCANVSKFLGLRCVIIFNLPESNMILKYDLTDKKGFPIIRFTADKRKTKTSVNNDKKKTDIMAHFDVNQALVIQFKEGKND